MGIFGKRKSSKSPVNKAATAAKSPTSQQQTKAVAAPKPVEMKRQGSLSLSQGDVPDPPQLKDVKAETNRDIQKESWHSEPLSIVVFGASGDLAKKKTYPALYTLFTEGSLSTHSIICGFARSQMSDQDLRDKLRPFLEKVDADPKKLDSFLKLCIYRNGTSYSDEDAIKALSDELKTMHKKPKVENRLFYFALPPTQFVSSASSIKKVAMSPAGYNRVVVEKPFGHDTESARELAVDLGKIFTEDYLYRIDHYLGKEMVQNLIVLRFGNTFLEPIWNRNYVSSVIVSFKEDIGTYGRGGYFDKSGIIRDVMQNHLMQVLSIIAMEPPVKVSGKNYANYVRDEKVKVLKSIRPLEAKDVVLGQYVGNGTEKGYLEDPTVPKDSHCPTFCTAVMYIDNGRWDGVPFIMKAGKALDNRRAEVRIQLKQPPGASAMFSEKEKIPNNELVIRLQPSEAIYMKTNVKKPGLHTVPIQSELDLSYDVRYQGEQIHDAYVRLVLDVLRGKQATFVRDDELMAAWEIVTPLLHQIDNNGIKPIPYKFGTRGPKEADELIAKVGYVRNTNYKWQGA